jgi:AcrR family transcriptional regulator
VVEGRRERKKQRTRDQIIRVAMDQFFKHGFDGATIAEIAEAADIAARTFWLHFPSKEAVVFSELDEELKALTERLDTLKPPQTVLEEIRVFILELLREHKGSGKWARRRLIRETPSLIAHQRNEMARFEAVLASAFAAEFGDPADSLRPRLAAAAMFAAAEAIFRRSDAVYEASMETDPLELTRDLDDAFTFLVGGLDALNSAQAIGSRAGLSSVGDRRELR